jgi:hypothetical protein
MFNKLVLVLVLATSSITMTPCLADVRLFAMSERITKECDIWSTSFTANHATYGLSCVKGNVELLNLVAKEVLSPSDYQKILPQIQAVQSCGDEAITFSWECSQSGIHSVRLGSGLVADCVAKNLNTLSNALFDVTENSAGTAKKSLKIAYKAANFLLACESIGGSAEGKNPWCIITLLKNLRLAEEILGIQNFGRTLAADKFDALYGKFSSKLACVCGEGADFKYFENFNSSGVTNYVSGYQSKKLEELTGL